MLFVYIFLFHFFPHFALTEGIEREGHDVKSNKRSYFWELGFSLFYCKWFLFAGSFQLSLAAHKGFPPRFVDPLYLLSESALVIQESVLFVDSMSWLAVLSEMLVSFECARRRHNSIVFFPREFQNIHFQMRSSKSSSTNQIQTWRTRHLPYALKINPLHSSLMVPFSPKVFLRKHDEYAFWSDWKTRQAKKTVNIGAFSLIH